MKAKKWLGALLAVVFALTMGLTLAACEIILDDDPVDTKVTVTYYDGSTVIRTEKVEAGVTAPEFDPADVGYTKEGYHFVDWYKEAALLHEFDFTAPITQDTNVYAKYTAFAVYTVTFDSAVPGSTPTEVSVTENEAEITLPEAPVWEGHTFLGWELEGEVYQPDATFTVEGNVTFTAKWEAYTFTHTAEKAATCEDDGNVEYYTCSACGKHFTAEDHLEEITDTVVKSSGHNIVTKHDKATHWTECANNCGKTTEHVPHSGYETTGECDGCDFTGFIQVKFVADETTTTKYFIEGTKLEESDCPEVPEKEGYRLIGWELTEGTYENDMLTENVTFTARWELQTFTVTYKNGEAVVYTVESVQWGTTHSITYTIDDEETRHFLGWALEDEPTAVVTSVEVKTNITLIAVWENKVVALDQRTYVIVGTSMQQTSSLYSSSYESYQNPPAALKFTRAADKNEFTLPGALTLYAGDNLKLRFNTAWSSGSTQYSYGAYFFANATCVDSEGKSIGKVFESSDAWDDNAYVAKGMSGTYIISFTSNGAYTSTTGRDNGQISITITRVSTLEDPAASEIEFYLVGTIASQGMNNKWPGAGVTSADWVKLEYSNGTYSATVTLVSSDSFKVYCSTYGSWHTTGKGQNSGSNMTGSGTKTITVTVAEGDGALKNGDSRVTITMA